MKAEEIKDILFRIENGVADMSDAYMLREFICHVLDVAISRADDYYESDDEWREILREVCDIEILPPETVAELELLERL